MIQHLRTLAQKNQRLTAWLPLVAVSALISYLSHIPNPPKVEMPFEYEDKILHLIAYTVWSSTLLWGYYWNGGKWSGGKLFLFLFIGTALFGFYDEYHQSFVPNRTATVWDWLADCLGAVVTFLVLRTPIYRLVLLLKMPHQESVPDEKSPADAPSDAVDTVK